MFILLVIWWVEFILVLQILLKKAVDLVSGKGSAAEFTDSVKSIFSGPVDEASSGMEISLLPSKKNKLT